MSNSHFITIAAELNIKTMQVENTVSLLDDGATIPFIARYRKEVTDSLDEVQISHIRDRIVQLRELDKRRKSIIESIREQGLLTDELGKQLNEAPTMSELEDIYLPYRPKRKTRATIAKTKGLEPLAKMIMAQYPLDLNAKALLFVDKEKGVETTEEALAGARDIIAEWVNENTFARKRMRNFFSREGKVAASLLKNKESDPEARKYEQYFDWNEPLSRAPSHRILAMFRGENEGYLKVEIEPTEEEALVILDKLFVKGGNESAAQVKMAVKDSYKRLLQPSMETEMRQLAKEKADTEAIRVFAENMRQLLLTPPLGQKNVLAIDPGFRTGCKVVCLDRQGNLLHNETIYPHPPQSEVKMAMNKIQTLVKAYKTDAIAIGNGTASRETENFIKHIKFDTDVIAVVVSENGASVYSASDVARQEFPDYDVTVRGSVSIGRRLMDPLAELVKIDPKSIGVGQYQHDVNQKMLQQSLGDVVVSCVNNVGVEVNTASRQLLSFVSGVGDSLAKNIVEYRAKNGPFPTRESLKKVPRFGEKAFEQAAGFLRIRDSANPLDRSAVHPESYEIVYRMAEKVGATVEDLMGKDDLRKKINLKDFVGHRVGLPTLNDIMQELAKPGRDPRKKFEFFEFDKGIHTIEDVREGMVLPGIITNITNFGVFVDLGVHQDGLVHISQLAGRFVKDPNEVVKLHQKVMVKVLQVDRDRKRIQLTMRDV